MSPRPLLLDLFCGAGGAAMGYSRAGFDVLGVDIKPQPRYPFQFVQGDAMRIAAELMDRFGFAAVHASPPCQAYTAARTIRGREHADLVAPVRSMLISHDLPWVIENVPGAPLRDPLILCGTMFGLRMYRHRLFESSIPLAEPAHPPHVAKCARMGRSAEEGEFMTLVGNFSGVRRARLDMGVPWMTRDEIREAIPPAYTEYIGRQLLAHVQRSEAA